MTLRARLFAAIGIAAILSVALALAIGAYLTRQAVERNTLRDVSAQADLLAERERNALLPFSAATLNRLQPFLDRQGERIVLPKLDGTSPYLPPDEAVLLRRGVPLNGTVTVDGERSFYAARLVGGKGFVLLRPTDVVASSWRPHVRGLLIGAVAAATLAALAAFFLARAIARPVRRVSEAARTLAYDESPEPIPVEGAARARRPRRVVQRVGRPAREGARGGAAVPPLRQPRAEDAADGDPRATPRGSPTACSTRARRRRRSGARPLRLERLVQDLLDLARMNKSEFSVAAGSDRPRRDRPRGGPALRGPGDRLRRRPRRRRRRARAGRRRHRPDGAGRLEPRRERAPHHAARRLGHDHRGTGHDRRRGHRARPARGRASARLRALLPLLALRPRAPGRHRASGSRS